MSFVPEYRNFASIFSQVATKATEQAHATTIGIIAHSDNKGKVAKKLNDKLDEFGGEVQRLIIGVQDGLHIPVDARARERKEDAGYMEPSVKYLSLSDRWLNKKRKAGVTPLPSFFKFGKARSKNKPAGKTLASFLDTRLRHSANLFGKIEAKDIKIYQDNVEITRKGGRFNVDEKALAKAKQVAASRVVNFSPKEKHYEVRVNLLKRIFMVTNETIGAIIDPQNDESSGFAYSKLTRYAWARPNAAYLLAWYKEVKLPAVIRKHYSYYGLLGG